jgi:hypothetical protein
MYFRGTFPFSAFDVIFLAGRFDLDRTARVGVASVEHAVHVPRFPDA